MENSVGAAVAPRAGHESMSAGETAGQDGQAALTVVTGADARFARTLVQLLRNLERRQVPRIARILVWDLGLAAADLATIARRFPFAHLQRFPFESHPAHVAVASGTFAWKPLLLADTAARFGGRILWLDSATLLHAGLDEPLAVMARTGLYTLKGQSALARRCRPEVIRHLAVEPALLDQPVRIGGLVGFDVDRPPVRQILSD